MFVDKDKPNHVYKHKKALYGLKQAPRAWYNLLSKFLLSQAFSKGTVDPTLFIKRQDKDILLVQIYVDDIIFASTTPELCDQFSKLMCLKFKMLMMGKISFFLGLQILQSPRGTFLNQSKYALESLKKYGMEFSDLVDTPMVDKSKLDEDPQGKVVDPTHYRGMVGTLMYLTANRPDLTFAVCTCARYQAKPTEKHLHAVKRIFKYLRGTINRGLIMDTTKAQQIALDDALVTPANHSKAYKEYQAIAFRAEPLKAKTKYKKADEPVTYPKSKTVLTSKGSRIKSLAKSKVTDEQQQKVAGTNKGAGVRPETINSLMRKKIKKAMTRLEGEEEQAEEELYGDLNINLQRSNAEMTDAQQENVQANQVMEDTHVILTTVPLAVQQQSSSVSSDLVSKFINPFLDTDIPNFASLFQFDQRVSVLETEMFEFRQTNQFTKAISLIMGIVDNYLTSKIKDVVDVAVQLQTNKLRGEAQAENQEFLNQVDSTMKTIIKEQVQAQAQVSKIMPKIEKYATKSLGAEILIDKMEENQSVNISDIQKNLYNALVKLYNSDKDIFSSYSDVVTLKRDRDDQDKDGDPFTGSN
nr:retrovirus-related Pol polyprotein from transposon TNT 1-94 [Tanacetum cinerariifolium]